jgi:hypothetical protein
MVANSSYHHVSSQEKFPPSNDRYAAIAYVFMFWVSRTMGAWSMGQMSGGGAGAGIQEVFTLMFATPIAIFWICFAYLK